MTPKETTEALEKSRIRVGELVQFLIQHSNELHEALSEIEDYKARRCFNKWRQAIQRFLRGNPR